MLNRIYAVEDISNSEIPANKISLREPRVRRDSELFARHGYFHAKTAEELN